jgi:WD40 repeat protein
MEWDVASGELLRSLAGHTGQVRSVAYAPDGESLASASDDYTVMIWDSAGDEPIRTLAGHNGCVLALAFSPDGTLLASGSYDGTIILWAVDW